MKTEAKLESVLKTFENGMKDLDDQYGIFSQNGRITKLETKRLIAIADATAAMLRRQVDALNSDSTQLLEALKKQQLDFESWAKKLGWLYCEDEEAESDVQSTESQD